MSNPKPPEGTIQFPPFRTKRGDVPVTHLRRPVSGRPYCSIKLQKRSLTTWDFGDATCRACKRSFLSMQERARKREERGRATP